MDNPVDSGQWTVDRDGQLPGCTEEERRREEKREEKGECEILNKMTSATRALLILTVLFVLSVVLCCVLFLLCV